MNAAADLVGAIGTRFAVGDPAEDLLQCLTARLADIERRVILAGREALQESREAIEALLTRLQTVVNGGEEWLTQADIAEPMSHHLRERLRRVYGLAAHD